MAIQPHHLNYFPSPHINPACRDMINMDFNPPMDFGLPLSAITADSTLPCFHSAWLPETFDSAADSGITSGGGTRKRSLDSFSSNMYAPRKVARTESVSFLGQDITFHLQQQQWEMDQLVTQHMEKVRVLLLQRRREHSRRVAAAIKEAILRKLREKEEEIQKGVKLNWVLEERVNALFLENQMWRNIAESHEATANVLRYNLQEILNSRQAVEEEAAADDAGSCCGSTRGEAGADVTSGGSRVGLCRKCGKEESTVVLLPCRHLCVCVSCATNLHNCLVCDSRNTGSVHVNM